jgi:hypothetical protein
MLLAAAATYEEVFEADSNGSLVLDRTLQPWTVLLIAELG